MDALPYLLGATAAVAVLSLWLRAFADAARRPEADFAAAPLTRRRGAWLTIIAGAGPFGALVYYLAARPKMPPLDPEFSSRGHER